MQGQEVALLRKLPQRAELGRADGGKARPAASPRRGLASTSIRIPNAAARSATASPIAPAPTMPSERPNSPRDFE